jgi:hypothetical protein
MGRQYVEAAWLVVVGFSPQAAVPAWLLARA